MIGQDSPRRTDARHTMRIAMLERMRLMVDDIAAEEAFASDFAEEAAQAERVGDSDTASIMRDLTRRHRVKVLEFDGRLAALRLHFAMTFGR